MRKFCFFVFVLLGMLLIPSITKAEQNLGRITAPWYTEVWHHSGGYWSGNINKTVYDYQIGDLIENPSASNNFTNQISKQVTIIKPFTTELSKYLDEGGKLDEVTINIINGNKKTLQHLYLDGSFHYELNVHDRNLIATFKPYYKLKSTRYFLDFDMPEPSYDCDYIKFSIYHKRTNQLLGVMAAKDDFDYSWIQGLSGELYHPSNPLVNVSSYGVTTQYHLNDLKIGNGTFKDGGAVGYFFTNAIIFELRAPDPVENPTPPDDPPDSIPSLNVFFSASCDGYVATNNPDYPVFVDEYPVDLDLHMDYEIVNNTITTVKVERQSGSYWIGLAQQNSPIYSHRYRTYRESETFRVTVYTTRMDPVSVTVSAYTKEKYNDEIPISVDFYLFDKNGRLVNDNYNNPIEVSALPDTLTLLNIIPDQDPNFKYVQYSLSGNSQNELLKNITWGNNDVPARYLTNYYSMFYLYNGMPPYRLPNHYVFFKIVEPELKVSATIEGYISRWDGGTDLKGNYLPRNDHRFLSMEKVKIRVLTEGGADKVIIRFSPELEAMTYRPEGRNYVYDMKEDYGIDYTYFPHDTTFSLDPSKDKNEVYWEYYLPLAKDTLDWEGRRVKPSYFMTVYAYRGDKCSTYTINDIEITGTVHDIIYIQPVL